MTIRKAGPGIIEFLIDPKDLDAALAVVREKTNGNCVIGTKERGNLLLVHVVAADLKPQETSAIHEALKERTELHGFAEGKADAEIDF